MPVRVPACVLTALASLAVASTLAAQATTVPPTGPHGVGRRSFTWVDSSRRDPADSTRPRTIPGWAWYPAIHAEGSRGELPLDSAWNDLRAAHSARKIGAAAAERMRTIRVHAASGAAWDPAVGRAPVLLFVPGNGWLPTDYSSLLEELASHGYVVIGITPTGLADVTRFADGRTVTKVLGNGGAIGVDQVHAHRDMLHVLASLRSMDADAASPLGGHLDLARIGTFGHSLGGTAALVAAARDTAVRAALNLDGDPMGDVVHVRPRQPILFVSHELPEMSEAPPAPDSAWTVLTRQGILRSEARRTGEWAAIASEAAWARRIRLLGFRHLDFTDATLASPLIVGPRLRWMRWGPIEGTRALRLASAVTRAFFDEALRGQAAGARLCDGYCAEPGMVLLDSLRTARGTRSSP